MEIINLTIDIMFIIDIAICFRVTYMTMEGEEITDPKKIAKRYMLHGPFIFDLLSVIPFSGMMPV